MKKNLKKLKKKVFRLGVILGLTLSLVGCKDQPPIPTISGPGVENILVEDILVEEVQVEEIKVNEIEVKPVEVKPVEIKTWEDSTTYWD